MAHQTTPHHTTSANHRPSTWLWYAVTRLSATALVVSVIVYQGSRINNDHTTDYQPVHTVDENQRLEYGSIDRAWNTVSGMFRRKYNQPSYEADAPGITKTLRTPTIYAISILAILLLRLCSRHRNFNMGAILSRWFGFILTSSDHTPCRRNAGGDTGDTLSDEFAQCDDMEHRIWSLRRLSQKQRDKIRSLDRNNRVLAEALSIESEDWERMVKEAHAILHGHPDGKMRIIHGQIPAAYARPVPSNRPLVAKGENGYRPENDVRGTAKKRPTDSGRQKTRTPFVSPRNKTSCTRDLVVRASRRSIKSEPPTKHESYLTHVSASAPEQMQQYMYMYPSLKVPSNPSQESLIESTNVSSRQLFPVVSRNSQRPSIVSQKSRLNTIRELPAAMEQCPSENLLPSQHPQSTPVRNINSETVPSVRATEGSFISFPADNISDHYTSVIPLLQTIAATEPLETSFSRLGKSTAPTEPLETSFYRLAKSTAPTDLLETSFHRLAKSTVPTEPLETSFSRLAKSTVPTEPFETSFSRLTKGSQNTISSAHIERMASKASLQTHLNIPSKSSISEVQKNLHTEPTHSKCDNADVPSQQMSCITNVPKHRMSDNTVNGRTYPMSDYTANLPKHLFSDNTANVTNHQMSDYTANVSKQPKSEHTRNVPKDPTSISEYPDFLTQPFKCSPEENVITRRLSFNPQLCTVRDHTPTGTPPRTRSTVQKSPQLCTVRDHTPTGTPPRTRSTVQKSFQVFQKSLRDRRETGISIPSTMLDDSSMHQLLLPMTTSLDDHEKLSEPELTQLQSISQVSRDASNNRDNLSIVCNADASSVGELGGKAEEISDEEPHKTYFNISSFVDNDDLRSAALLNTEKPILYDTGACGRGAMSHYRSAKMGTKSPIAANKSSMKTATSKSSMKTTTSKSSMKTNVGNQVITQDLPTLMTDNSSIYGHNGSDNGSDSESISSEDSRHGDGERNIHLDKILASVSEVGDMRLLPAGDS